MVAARDLQETVELQSASTTPDTTGGRSRSWATTYTVRAHVKNVRGAERLVQGETRTLETYLVTIRRMSGLSMAMRVLWGSLTMNIASIRGIEDSRSQWLVLECEVGARE